MSAQRIFSFMILLGLLLSGCGENEEPIPVQSEQNSTPTATLNAEVTVCADGCDFTLIQAAIDAKSTSAETIISIVEPVHTEAGILVSKNIVIRGQGAKTTIVQAHANPGEGTQRVFEIPLDVSVSIRDMTIQHGMPNTSPLTGGGILNYGTLTLENTLIRQNFGSAGGGIYNEGTLTLINSTVSDNGSLGGGDAYLECQTGGGIKAYTGTVTLINSTVSGNKSRSKGGGIHVACSGTLILENSTISGNIASESGGGVYLNGVGKFTNSTISNNDASNVGGLNIEGTGEHNLIRGQLDLVNTIIANNTARLPDYGIADCYMNQHATTPTNQFNWIGDGNCNPTFSGDPLLGPLADNGASTQTHSLLPGSSAIDVIPAESCSLDTDQRGEARLAPCDIGAFEVQNP